MKYLETTIESGIFDGIGKSEYINAFEELKVSGKKMRKDQAIFFEDDIIDKICIVNRGTVRGEKAYSDGDVHIMQIFEENAMFGMEAAVSKLKTSPMDYVCNEDCVIVFITLNSIARSVYFRQITDVLMQKLADDNIKKMHKIEILAQMVCETGCFCIYRY